MNNLTNLFRGLIKLAGKVVFVIGLVLNILMLFWGFWPSLIYIFFMLFGAGLIVINKDVSLQNNFNWNDIKKEIATLNFKIIKIDYNKSLSVLIKTFFISSIVVLASIIFIYYFGQSYFKKRNTINDCKEISIALNQYKEINHKYPNTLSLIISSNPLRFGWLKDDWNNLYQYSSYNNGDSYSLLSAGKDGIYKTNDDIVFTSH